MTAGRTQAGRSALLLIPLAALIAVAPLIVHGCSCGHDFDFHLLSWMEAARQFSQGNLHPHWAFTPAFNAGEPRFVFYPPISWYVGALLGLILTHLPLVSQAAAWSAAPILFTWIALTLSGLTMYRLARSFASANAALLAATIYLANPYMLFTAYERTAYAELLAAAWIPLLLHAILRDRVTIPRIALPVALLWLTNAPAAVMGSYTLALLAALRLVTNPDVPHLASETWVSRRRSALQIAWNTIAGTILGFGLAAFYILPAAYQRRFVQISMATIAGMRIDQNFLFEHTGVTPDQLLHDQVLHTASLIAVILLAAAAVALFAAWLRGTSRATHPGAPGPDSQTWESIHNLPFPSVPLAILTPAIAFLLTPLGAPIWRHAPEMQFLQFPWRLLAVLAPVFALALARALSPAIPPIASKQDQDPDTPQTAGAPGLASETWVLPDAPSIAAVSRSAGYKTLPAFALLLAASLTIPAYHIFHQPCDPEDTAPARLALFHSNSGTDPTDEYTPATADNDALQPDNPPYWLAPDPNDGPLAVAPIYQTDKDSTAPPAPGPAPRDLALNLQNPEFLILNLRDYPAWRILRNGALVTARTPRGDGLIAIPIPAGASTLDIHYAQTPDQTLGGTITLLALTLFLFTLYRPPSGHSAPPAESQ